MKIIVLAGIALFCFARAGFCQDVSLKEGEAIIETLDGMILAGNIEESTSGEAALRTEYGLLQIPLNCIRRVNGDRYDPAIGIVREQSIAIESDGDVVFESIVPISSRSQDGYVNILIEGNVLDIKDLNDHSLPFMGRQFSGFTRCAVQVPSYRLSALLVRSLIKKGALADNDNIRYAYQYIPQTNQNYRLRLTLPPNSLQVEAAPEFVRDASGALIWERSLKRQEKTDFEVSFCLPPSQP
ncbi:MAG: hypothetical protein AB1656_24775 [Candidatus Omnitrophota bacterium]